MSNVINTPVLSALTLALCQSASDAYMGKTYGFGQTLRAVRTHHADLPVSIDASITEPTPRAAALADANSANMRSAIDAVRDAIKAAIDRAAIGGRQASMKRGAGKSLANTVSLLRLCVDRGVTPYRGMAQAVPIFFSVQSQ